MEVEGQTVKDDSFENTIEVVDDVPTSVPGKRMLDGTIDVATMEVRRVFTTGMLPLVVTLSWSIPPLATSLK